MTPSEKYVQAYMETFQVEAAALGSEFEVSSVENWDSITHITLISALEDAFDIMLDPEDIIEFASFEGGKAILAKYNVII